ncbi:MAG TPA: hydrogenase formation protein HypD [Candidatus Sumerlaeota bacterium]|nr:hydrogenase formation protein HypD [Candidatus Sumerlaeota bacterium]HOR26427.1 hydrogenase formation protein HypD [Candidatus Sumerlaeota bacterium]HPK03268.1 hydrogenase formation protein HypD [Candidatus Sumerlaeota bacterium]
MKYLDEYRDADAVRRLAAAIGRAATRPWTIMEICGGQTHAILRFGLDELLPPEITLIHGPGCPVCVTPVELIDKALAIAARPGVIFCSFGDMLRVPGSRGADGRAADLMAVRAAGGDVRVVYSPLDAVALARANPSREVVFFAIGFETTAPANALAAALAAREGLVNFSLLVSHVLVPPAISAILGSPDCRVQGLLAAGHVCAVMGAAACRPIAARHRVPVVVTGFEPVDLLDGVLRCIRQLEAGRAEVENAYARAVADEGNPHARRRMEEVFEVCDRSWRGLGRIPRSGLRLRSAYAAFDAERRFGVEAPGAGEPAECLSGLVLQGLRRPTDCPAFATRCTPECPLGAPMVSAEGACAAYFRYRPSHSRQDRGTILKRGAAR